MKEAWYSFPDSHYKWVGLDCNRELQRIVWVHCYWQGKEPDKDTREEVSSGFVDYLKIVIGKIPFVKDVVGLFLLFNSSDYPLIIKGVCVFALLYFITPIDVVPDIMPIVGFLDDAGIIAAAVTLYSSALDPYKKMASDWLKENGFRN